jgi:uncharacterized protein YbjT (DUF2867 family)
LLTQEGLGAAVDGVDVVVHCATNPYKNTWQTDVEGTQSLLDEAARAGVRHFVYVSIVGVDRIPLRYYKAKVAAEWVVRRSEVPWTILRATQFHDLILRALQDLMWGPVVPVPKGFSFQPLDPRDVADRLVELATARPAGRVPDMGGPEVLDARELARSYLERVGARRPVVTFPLPGAAARAFRSGANLAPDATDGTITWRDFLASTRKRTRTRATR